MSLDQPAQFVKHQTITRDAFLGGRLTLSQPRNGFRAGLDSVLLGAAVPAGTRNLLDMGAGVGAAGLSALAMGLAEKACLVERDDATLGLARDNIVQNGFADRADLLALDILSKGAERRAAGLGDNAHDVVIANPPFFGAGQGTRAPDAARANARHMDADSLETWVKCAATAASAGGRAIFIYPAEGLAALLTAFDRRFGDINVLPLCPRPAQSVTRILVRGIKGSRAPVRLLASRPLHGEFGNGFAPEFDAILRGAAVLDW
ncbi:tRNA1(Val) A37 N6-methylase TrmN6 [Devosia subaequoris]|uniref:tRNA1(Val) A37 N6-methylase TrmN6 n=1 Tax=Devosia subaequoris TaxID=395930 RepID=A0A7W6IPE6_9HYPH|nr:methyltransferase [Devosia subaequoris]MBB4053295.1 tRNA1(Val) A37 N6-methylase TrmN6 [Devosia subaequoris]MCP1210575.1 methyltransferase [Devosia subaequoris]